MKYAIATLIFVTLMALFMIMALTVGDAKAAEVCGYISKAYRGHWSGDIVYRRVYSCRPERHYYAAPRRDYDDDDRWERRDPQSERGVQCKDSGPVRVVGGKHLTQPGAIKDAVARWETSIGYDFGEKFANMENARGYKWRCDKASTVETTIGRVGEGIANAVTGGNADAYYKRCVVLATPCMQPVVRGDRDGSR